ncbi:hypothetical protein PORY_001895 [Pneumocystis oryctolagi]|uniref:Uncharacterized protein n=1 Tax=Pneumocystis oryctolagi TaxID=42067 RepID=A0ACB7CEC8_9ASCO|nr:hypothetical protein PORY_001895 [Pneumocystis oryctolagi]
MKYWKYINITQTNYPMLFPDEKILFIQSSVTLYDPFFEKYFHKEGTVYLTTHRICFIYPSTSFIEPLGLDLSKIEKLDASGGIFKSSQKITIYYKKVQSIDESETSKTTTKSKTSSSFTENSWICTVCSFYNSVPENYSIEQPLPPCLTCGVSTYNFLSSLPKSSSITISSVKNSEFLECHQCTFLNHPALKQCESCGIHLISQENNTRSFDSDSIVKYTRSSSQKNIKDSFCKLEFKSGGEKPFYERLKEAICQKLWMIKTNKIEHHIDKNKKIGGISILQNVKENVLLNNAHILNHGLSDLNTLMSKAKELVALANSLRLELQTSPNVSYNTQNTLQDSIQTIGIQTPIQIQDFSDHLVTKTITKDDNMYYIELAKQIAEFLGNGVLKKEGGIMTLTDVFALYNRARGVDLISPEDLLRACEYYKTLNLSIKLRRFESGLLVLQEKEKNEEKIIAQLTSWIKNTARGVTPFEVADQFQWSMGIAYETLRIAEQEGLLCRDQCFEGLYFWENRIVLY